ncbi:hypothetical protein CK247_31590, partial [Klebsiella pneumoniae]
MRNEHPAASPSRAACGFPELFVVEPFPAVHHLVDLMRNEHPAASPSRAACGFPELFVVEPFPAVHHL